MGRLLAVALLLSSSTTFADSGEGDSNIIGGTATTVGQFPSVVALTIGGGLCTGTLIDPEWVLTAAHCVDPEVVRVASQEQVTANTRVHFGTVNVFQDPGTTVNAALTIKKPQFNINALGSNDVGLVKLSRPVNDIEVSPVNLNPALAPVGVSATLVGYGATAAGGGGSVGKQFFLTNRVSSSCDILSPGLNASLLCFNQTDAKGQCQGDSGGPAFATINGKLTVVGITSFGDMNCAQFGADTRTDAEKVFILASVPEVDAMCTTADDCAPGVCFRGQCIAEPFTEGGIGSTCTAATECDSAQCAAGPDGMRCTELCTPGSANNCPDGFECLGASGGQGACWPEDADGGCCDASGQGAPTALLGIGFLVVLLRRRRR